MKNWRKSGSCHTHSLVICTTFSMTLYPADTKCSVYWCILMDSSHSATVRKGIPSEPLVLGRRMEILQRQKKGGPRLFKVRSCLREPKWLEIILGRLMGWEFFPLPGTVLTCFRLKGLERGRGCSETTVPKPYLGILRAGGPGDRHVPRVKLSQSLE